MYGLAGESHDHSKEVGSSDVHQPNSDLSSSPVVSAHVLGVQTSSLCILAEKSSLFGSVQATILKPAVKGIPTFNYYPRLQEDILPQS